MLRSDLFRNLLPRVKREAQSFSPEKTHHKFLSPKFRSETLTVRGVIAVLWSLPVNQYFYLDKRSLGRSYQRVSHRKS